MNEDSGTPHLTRDEVEHAIRSLSTADWARLERLATRFASGKPISAPDLLQEGLSRSIDGRSCPAGLGIIQFLAGIMRSIADGEREKALSRPVLVTASTSEAVELLVLDHPDATANAEEELIAEESANRIRSEILALFDDNQVARDVAEGIMEELTTDELRELSGLDKTAYDSVRKLIHRRIAKRYPEGWKP